MGFEIKNALNLSHHYIRNVVKEGDWVIDGTIGNGRDTCFLAELVGENGKVFGFDIQEIALQRASQRLHEENLFHRVQLIKDSHANILDHVNQPIRAAMFNLGYLPSGDHGITTLYSSTIRAIESCCHLLAAGGLITICVYYGHQQGKEEKEHIKKYLQELDCKKYMVLHSEFINQINNPPLFIVIQKN